jgi:type IV secretory pathway protease TraF
VEPAVDPSPIEAVPFRLPDRAGSYEHGRPWRVIVAEGSMRPALEPGDWLLVDPTTQRWPRRGAIVVVRQPASGLLVVKRVAARPGDTISVAGRPVRLGPTEAWLLGDAPAVSVDSRIYGPVTLDHLVGRAWLRYGPMGRPLGLIDRPSPNHGLEPG